MRRISSHRRAVIDGVLRLGRCEFRFYPPEHPDHPGGATLNKAPSVAVYFPTFDQDGKQQTLWAGLTLWTQGLEDWDAEFASLNQSLDDLSIDQREELRAWLKETASR